MSYKALYRTYRPSTFDEVVGQDHIVKTIKNALTTGKIAHAYLFAGPRGTGKTTMAKLFAKALNCDEGIGHQCENCKNCIAIKEGNHPDVIEIDAASNNGVEEVRELIDKVRYSTILGRYKVYIIDEVHMMTSGAFNALLKTLEEPPAHVIFILATTEPHKILPTILSRCQRYDFSKINDTAIKERLKFVLEEENIAYDDEAINLIISLSDGGMRDALSILDQVLAYTSNTLNANDILDIFQLESKEEKIALINDLALGNTAQVLDRINSYIVKGSDIKRLTSDLLDIYKDILIYQRTNSLKYTTSLKEEHIKQLSDLFIEPNLIENIDILLDTIKDFKNVSSIIPLFEIALLKLSKTTNVTPTFSKPIVPEEPIVKEEVLIEEIIEEKKEIEIKEEQPKVEIKKKEEIKQDIQPSLFDEDMISSLPIDKNLVYPLDSKVNEDGYVLNDDLVIKIFTIAKKELKNNLIKDWELLKGLSSHPELGSKANLLYDSHLLVATKNILIVTHDLTNKVNKINNTSAQSDLQKITQIVFKKKMFVYSLSRNESVALQQKFINLKQVGKLAKPDTIEIMMMGE